MNRILRPSGYFILSTKHDNIEEEEGMAFMSFFFLFSFFIFVLFLMMMNMKH